MVKDCYTCAIGYYASATAEEPLVAFCYPQSLLGQPGVGLLESISVQLRILGLSRGTILITRVRVQRRAGYSKPLPAAHLELLVVNQSIWVCCIPDQ
jgi:hypothetical protein